MTDTVAYNYIKAITKQKEDEEAKERYRRWEKEKMRKAALAQNLWDQKQSITGH